MKQRAGYILFLYCLITGVWLSIAGFGWFEWFDLKVMDMCMRYSLPAERDSSIVVVEYDDETMENLPYALTHQDIAALVQIIEEQRPRVLAVNPVSLYDILGGRIPPDFWMPY